jgi:hypothetical protein
LFVGSALINWCNSDPNHPLSSVVPARLENQINKSVMLKLFCQSVLPGYLATSLPNPGPDLQAVKPMPRLPWQTFAPPRAPPTLQELVDEILGNAGHSYILRPKRFLQAFLLDKR